MKASGLTFGLKLDDEAALWWGARAIFERRSKYQLQLLWDRQSWTGGSQAQRDALSAAINTALPGLRAFCAEEGPDLYDASWEHVQVLCIGGMAFHVSCRRKSDVPSRCGAGLLGPHLGFRTGLLRGESCKLLPTSDGGWPLRTARLVSGPVLLLAMGCGEGIGVSSEALSFECPVPFQNHCDRVVHPPPGSTKACCAPESFEVSWCCPEGTICCPGTETTDLHCCDSTRTCKIRRNVPGGTFDAVCVQASAAASRSTV